MIAIISSIWFVFEVCICMQQKIRALTQSFAHMCVFKRVANHSRRLQR